MLLRFELKKILRKKVLWVVFCSFIVLNIYGLGQEVIYTAPSDPNYNYVHGRELMYQQVEGAINEENINFVLNGWEKTKAIVDATQGVDSAPSDEYYTKYVTYDFSVYDEMKTEMQRQFEYNETMEKLCSIAEENMRFVKDKSGYEFNRNRLISEVYENRHCNSFYDLSGYKKYLSYDFSTLLIVLLLLLSLTSLMSYEHESGMYILLQTSRFGKYRLLLNKLGAAVIFTLLISLPFFLVDLVYFFVTTHMAGAMAPLYSIKDFQFTPLTISISGYVVLLWGIKILSFISIGTVFILFSSLFKQTYLAFILNVLYIAIMMWCGNDLLLFNPISSLTYNVISQDMRVIRLGDTPVLAVWAQPFSILMLTIMCTVLIIVIYRSGRQFSLNKLFHMKGSRREAAYERSTQNSF